MQTLYDAESESLKRDSSRLCKWCNYPWFTDQLESITGDDMQMLASEFPPKFFYKGLRAPVGGVGNDEQGEKVGVFIMKQAITFDGEIIATDPPPILMADQGYPEASDPDEVSPWFPALLRLESDLASTKPFLDLIVINDLINVGATDPVPPDPVVLPITTKFGRVSINGGAAINLDYGWLSRGENSRLILAADPALNWSPPNIDYIPNGENLPPGFDNQFHNGSLISGLVHLNENDEVSFIQMNTVGDDIADYNLIIPSQPNLNITIDGLPVVMQLLIPIGVDTVILDLKNSAFLVTWRGVFLWQEQFSNAVLEVS